MAKGGGGEGHYDERRRPAAAAKPKRVSTGYADSPEVLAAIQKPSGVTKKPVVVGKKPIVKPRLKPSGIVLTTARKGNLEGEMVNTAAKEGLDTGSVSPASVITAPRKYPSPTSAAKGNRGGNYTPQRDKDNAFPNISNYDPGGGLYGQGKSLLDWVKRRGSRRMLDM